MTRQEVDRMCKLGKLALSEASDDLEEEDISEVLSFDALDLETECSEPAESEKERIMNLHEICKRFACHMKRIWGWYTG